MSAGFRNYLFLCTLNQLRELIKASHVFSFLSRCIREQHPQPYNLVVSVQWKCSRCVVQDVSFVEAVKFLEWVKVTNELMAVEVEGSCSWELACFH